MTDSWAHRLYQAIRNILPWPQFVECRPPLVINRRGVVTDDELEFDRDLQHFKDLEADIHKWCHLTKFEVGPDIFRDFVATPLLEFLEFDVKHTSFWDTWDWPDHAANLLSMWKHDRELQAWLDALEVVTW